MRNTSLALLVLALAVAGCDHSTNNQPVPEVHDFEILTPAQNSDVDGTVEITVKFEGAPPEKIEFYVNGTLQGARESAPWQYWWNTEGQPSKSQHILTARAYSKASSFRSTPEVNVRIK